MSINFEDLRYDRDYNKQNTFILSEDDEENSMFQSLADPKFDPFGQGSIFADTDFWIEIYANMDLYVYMIYNNFVIFIINYARDLIYLFNFSIHFNYYLF